MSRLAERVARAARAASYPVRVEIIALLTVEGELTLDAIASVLRCRRATVRLHIQSLTKLDAVELSRPAPARKPYQQVYRLHPEFRRLVQSVAPGLEEVEKRLHTAAPDSPGTGGT